ncbi:MAG: PP2C family protein-serine/threonine phosphatase, partial [Myxococcota bacterium]
MSINIHTLLHSHPPEYAVASLIEHCIANPTTALNPGLWRPASSDRARSHAAELLRHAWPTSDPRNQAQLALAEQILGALANLGHFALPSIEHLSTSHPTDAIYLETIARFIASEPPPFTWAKAIYHVDGGALGSFRIGRAQALGPRSQLQDYALVGSCPHADGTSIVLVVLADGHGTFGATAARKVSHLFAQRLTEHMHFTGARLPNAMHQAIAEADSALCTYLTSLNPGEEPDGGSTLLAVAVSTEGVYLAHVGDSRGYALSETTRQLTRLTQEHPFEVALNNDPPPSPEAMPRMMGHPHLKSSGRLSARPDVCSLGQLQPGHTILLASDGLARLSDKQIEACLLSSHAKPLSHALIDAVVQNARDNVS